MIVRNAHHFPRRLTSNLKARPRKKLPMVLAGFRIIDSALSLQQQNVHVCTLLAPLGFAAVCLYTREVNSAIEILIGLRTQLRHQH